MCIKKIQHNNKNNNKQDSSNKLIKMKCSLIFALVSELIKHFPLLALNVTESIHLSNQLLYDKWFPVVGKNTISIFSYGVLFLEIASVMSVTWRVRCFRSYIHKPMYVQIKIVSTYPIIFIKRSNISFDSFECEILSKSICSVDIVNVLEFGILLYFWFCFVMKVTLLFSSAFIVAAVVSSS